MSYKKYYLERVDYCPLCDSGLYTVAGADHVECIECKNRFEYED